MIDLATDDLSRSFDSERWIPFDCGVFIGVDAVGVVPAQARDQLVASPRFEELTLELRIVVLERRFGRSQRGQEFGLFFTEDIVRSLVTQDRKDSLNRDVECANDFQSKGLHNNRRALGFRLGVRMNSET